MGCRGVIIGSAAPWPPLREAPRCGMCRHGPYRLPGQSGVPRQCEKMGCVGVLQLNGASSGDSHGDFGEFRDVSDFDAMEPVVASIADVAKPGLVTPTPAPSAPSA